MAVREIKKSLLPNFSDLTDYVLSRLDSLLQKGSNPKLDAFCELNAIQIFRTAFLPHGFQLGVRFDRTMMKVSPLDDKNRLWLERYLCAELDVESVDQNSDGGGYVFYTMRPPMDRYDLICPGRGCREFWWDGGAWYAHG